MVIEYFLEWVETASVAKRAEAAGALVRAFLRNDISAEEREDLEAAITTLLEDPSPTVRLALAESLGAWRSAPRHVVSALAADTTEIAIIVLSRSPVFHDVELIEAIKTSEIERQIAVSCRPWLSPPVIKAICEHGCEQACLGALMNPAARFTQDDLHAIAQRFGQLTEIRLILTDRTDLAAETKLLLIGKLGDALSGFVSSRGWIQETRAKNVVAEAFDKASIAFVANAEEDDVTYIVRNMIASGHITASYLLRAVCMGNITLVARAFSELSGVRFSRVETILTKDRKSAFKAVYDRAGLPQSAFVVFQTAISSWRKLLLSGANINEARLPYLVTREVLETYSGQKDEVVGELLVLLRKLSAETARASAKSKASEIAQRAASIAEAEEEFETEEITEVDLDAIEFDTEELVAEFTRGVAVDAEVVEVEPQDAVTKISSGEIFGFTETEHDVIDVEDFSSVIMHAPVAKAA